MVPHTRLGQAGIVVLAVVLVLLPAAAAAPGDGDLRTADQPLLSGALSADGAGELLIEGVPESLAGHATKLVVERVYEEYEYVRHPAGGEPVETGAEDPTSKKWTFTDARFLLTGVEEDFLSLAASTDATITMPPQSVEDLPLVAHKNPYLVTDDGSVDTADPGTYTYAAEGPRFPLPAWLPTMEGDFTLFVSEAAFEVHGAEGAARTFEAGTYHNETGPATYTEGEAWYLVTFESGVLDLVGGTATAWLSEPLLTFSGTLVSDEATGRVRVDGTAHMIESEPVRLEGTLALAPRPDGVFVPADGVGRTGTGAQTETGTYSGTGAAMEGQVDRLVVGVAPVSLVTEDAAAVAAASVGILALVGVVVAFTQQGKWALFGVFAPLYAKTEKDNLLDNASRERIFEAIQANPGINLSQVHRLAELGWGVTVYHLKMLEKNGIVFSDARGRDRCFFENTPENRAMQGAIAALANKERAQEIASIVVAEPGLNQREVVRRAGVSQRAASYYLSKLNDQGLVETRREKNFARYFATDRLVDALAAVTGVTHEPEPKGETALAAADAAGVTA